MTFARECFGFFKRARFLKNFPWSSRCTFSENSGFGWPCENCHNLAIRALLEPLFAPKFFPVIAIKVHCKCVIMTFSREFLWAFQTRATFLSAYQLEDNDMCASVRLGLLNEAYFLGDFWKISLGSPFALFQKMRVLGRCENFHNLAIRALLKPLFAQKTWLVFAM